MVTSELASSWLVLSIYPISEFYSSTKWDHKMKISSFVVMLNFEISLIISQECLHKFIEKTIFLQKIRGNREK